MSYETCQTFADAPDVPPFSMSLDVNWWFKPFCVMVPIATSTYPDAYPCGDALNDVTTPVTPELDPVTVSPTVKLGIDQLLAIILTIAVCASPSPN